MSLHTMAKKSKAKRNVSVGKSGFTLQGSIRNHSYIGTTSKNSSVRTLFKGTEARGHGGCCGTYFNQTLCNDSMPRASATTADNGTIYTTSGLLSTRVHNLTVCSDDSCSSYNTVKQFNPLDHSQSQYVKKVKVAAICDTSVSVDDAGIRECPEGCNTTYYIGTRKVTTDTYSKDAESGAMTAGDYTDMVLLKNKCLPTPPCKKPFPMILNRNGCLTEYYTPQEAIEAGLLPTNWMNCGATDSAYESNPYE